MPRLPCLLSLLALLMIWGGGQVHADGPADNQAEQVRRVPKLGIEVPAADAEELQKGLGDLDAAIKQILSQTEAPVVRLREKCLPDVQVFHKAVHDALKYNEFFSPNDIEAAKQLLGVGLQRAAQLRIGVAPWLSEPGLIVRGYVSRIDGSIQPYGLVIPSTYQPGSGRKLRLDVWMHGRGETLSEVNFLNQRQRVVGQFAPPDTIVLHPYGRYCNANKFAGEIDVLEGIEAVGRDYPIDEDRTTVRGFSMGGAACWQMAVHYADMWAAAAPGAGFSETPEFLKFFQKETLNPTWYERELWHMYDCTDVAINLFNCPTVAYSGELDIQKQAADIMETALKDVGIQLTHIIGPGTKHSYHPDAVKEIERRMTSIVEKGRNRAPETVHFATYTLRYNRMYWVTVDALREHWKQTYVNAHINGRNSLFVETKNATALTLSFPSGWAPFDVTLPVEISIDGQPHTLPHPESDRSWKVSLHQVEGAWKLGPQPTSGLRKVHGLQGPIDDAFMDSFIFVKPSGQSAHPKVEAWVQAEMERAIIHWRRQFRGEARVKLDTEVTPEDVATSNIVVWGDAASNAYLAKVAGKLPISWNGDGIVAGTRNFAADKHALIAVYPNPENPQRYLVLNSGFTFRDYDYLNNARQVPKLPDWAVINLDTPPNSRTPGEVVDADFFGEEWELLPAHKD